MVELKRDDDFIRKILLEYETEEDWLLIIPGNSSDASDEERKERKERYHILLLMDLGLLVEAGRGTMRLTAAGHDFLDAIRSESAWARTKKAVVSGGAVPLAILRDIAIAYVRQEASKLLGLPL